MTITPDTLRQGTTLAARSATGPLIVNRYDGDDGSINWQLQQERPDPGSEDGAEVICAVSDRDWKNARQTAEFFAWCAAHAGELCVEVERLTAALAVAERAASLCAGEVAELRRAAAPTRGSLSVAYNSACARRVEAEEALRRAPMGKRGEEAQRRLADALADEAAKRAALEAYDREHGEPGRVQRDADPAEDPCPGSRGW